MRRRERVAECEQCGFEGCFVQRDAVSERGGVGWPGFGGEEDADLGTLGAERAGGGDAHFWGE